MAGFLTYILLFPSLSILKSGFQLQQVLKNSAELTVAETALDSNEIPFFIPNAGTKFHDKSTSFDQIKKLIEKNYLESL